MSEVKAITRVAVSPTALFLATLAFLLLTAALEYETLCFTNALAGAVGYAIELLQDGAGA